MKSTQLEIRDLKTRKNLKQQYVKTCLSWPILYRWMGRTIPIAWHGIVAGHLAKRCLKKQNVGAVQTMEAAKMARNANKKILHVSIFCLFFSLGMMVVLSCISVAPEALPCFERLFYCFVVMFVISLCISFCVCSMRIQKIVLTVFMSVIFAAFIILVLVKRWQAAEDTVKYERTTQTMVHIARGTLNGHRMPFPAVDAWGSKFLSETNDMEIVYISQGANLYDTNDDIVLRVGRKTNSYSISYTYDSHHFTSAVSE